MADSHWLQAPSNISLPLDKDVLERLAKQGTSLLVIHGMTGIGKSHTHGRLYPELTKTGWTLRDLSVGEDVNAVLRSVWSERKPTILFVDSIPWERFQKGQKSRDLPADIHHRVNKDDATSFTRNLLDHYEEVRDLPGLRKHLWADHAQHGNDSLVGRLLRLSRWFDGEIEVYLPCAIVANLHDFLEKSKFHKDTLPQEIQGAVSNYKRELSNQEANLQILSTALTGGVALGTAWGPALAGISALTSVLVGLGLAAAGVSIYTFFTQRKQQKKNVPIEVENWVKAVAVWTPLPEWRKDLICYDVDRRLGAPLGSASVSMANMSRDQDPRKALLRGIENLLGSPSDLQRVKVALGIQSVEEVQDELEGMLDALRLEVTKLRGEVAGERKERVEQAHAMEKRLDTESSERLRLEQELRALQEQKEWRDPSKQQVSWKHVESFSRSDLPKLMATLNLQFYSPDEESGVPSFVPFGDTKLIASRLSSGQNLLLTGRSGSGKSRFIYEAIERRLSTNVDLWLVGPGVDGKSGLVQELIDELHHESKNDSPRLLVWDNFPRGLTNGQDVAIATEILRMLAGSIAEGLQAIFSLDPHEYDSLSEIGRGIPFLLTLDVQYSLSEFTHLLDSLGRFQLGKEYERRVGPKSDHVAKTLFSKFNRPIQLTYYLQALRNNPHANAEELARRMVTRDLLDTIRTEFQQLDGADEDLRKRNAAHSNMDLLYSIKLAQVLAIGTSTAKVESLQKKVFGTQPSRPLHHLRGWIEMVSGSYFLHDLYADALLVSEDASKEISDAMCRFGVVGLVDPDYDGAPVREVVQSTTPSEKRLVVKAEPGELLGLGRFVGENWRFMGPEKAAIVLCKENLPDRTVLQGIGESFGRIPSRDWGEFVKVIASEKDEDGLEHMGMGAGSAFAQLSAQDKERLLVSARRHGKIASGLGKELGSTFWSLPLPDRDVLTKFARKSHGFGYWFSSIGHDFNHLAQADKNVVIDLATLNPEFASGLGFKIVLSDLSPQDRETVLNLARSNYAFASTFLWEMGEGKGDVLNAEHVPFYELPPEMKDTLLDVALKATSSKTTGKKQGEGFHWFGEGIGTHFDRLPDSYRGKMMELARQNLPFAHGFLMGFVHSPTGHENLGKLHAKDFTDVLDVVGMTDSQGRGFAIDILGQHVGMDFPGLSDGCKDRVLQLVESNRGFGRGVGLQIGRRLPELQDKYVEKVFRVARKCSWFSVGLPHDSVQWYPGLPEERKNWLLGEAKRSRRMASMLGEAFHNWRFLEDRDPDQPYQEWKYVTLADGEKTRIIEFFDVLIASDPSNPAYHADKGNLLFDKGRFEDALREIDRAITLSPGDVNYLNNKAWVLSVMGRDEEAVKEWDEAIRRDPKAASSHYNKATWLSKRGRMDAALGEYDLVISSSPSSSDLHRLACNDKAYMLGKEHRYSEALEVAKSGRESHPSSVKLLFTNAEIHAMNGQLERGVEVLVKATSKDKIMLTSVCKNITLEIEEATSSQEKDMLMVFAKKHCRGKSKQPSSLED